ncbi:velvet factor [Mycena polygramma]|nr:velvet factor [Mycena polygramma]
MAHLVWHLEEKQSPIAGRKSSPGSNAIRPIDPPPVVRLFCTHGGQEYNHRCLPNFNIRSLACTVDLFRLPEGPNPRRNYSYYDADGTHQQERPVYALFTTDYPDTVPFECCVGTHLLLEKSKETHLLLGQTVAQAYEDAGHIIFAFPQLGVLQTGQYLLRYTVYNQRDQQLLSAGQLVTKHFGQAFTISTVKQFPGTQPTTPLSRSLAAQRVPGFGNRHHD